MSARSFASSASANGAAIDCACAWPVQARIIARHALLRHKSCVGRVMSLPFILIEGSHAQDRTGHASSVR
jgi:hypothetical protein